MAASTEPNRASAYRPMFAWCCVLFVAAFLVRWVAEEVRPKPMMLTSYETWNIAIAFAQTGCLCNPYLLPTGPSAHANPLYPLILGTAIRLTGEAPPGYRVHFFLNIALASLMWAGVPLFAVATGLPSRIGILSGLLGAAAPVHMWVQNHRGEPALTALLLMAALGSTAWGWRKQEFNLRAGLIEGVLWGLAILSCASTLPVFALVLLSGFFIFRKAQWKPAIAAFAMALMVISPWLIRNGIVLGSPVLRSNFGLELRTANNEFATADSEDNVDAGIYHKLHPILSPEEAARVRDMGETAYNRVKMREAVGWISSNRMAFLRLVVWRTRNFWVSSPNHPLNLILDLAVTISAVLGLYLATQSRQYPYLITALVCMWVGYAPIYSIVQSSVRYSYPVHWSLVLLTGILIATVWERATAGRSAGIGTVRQEEIKQTP